MVYMQHVRFAIGGLHKFSPQREESPKAIQAVWGPGMATPENPGPPAWVELSKSKEGPTLPFEVRVVTLNYAVGRIARLACSSWNAVLVSYRFIAAFSIDL